MAVWPLIGDEMKANIVLIGFMGVGKGRTARTLAEKTGMFAVDCDDLIESFANGKVRRFLQNMVKKSSGPWNDVLLSGWRNM